MQPPHQSEPVKFMKMSRFVSAANFFAAPRSVVHPSEVAITGVTNTHVAMLAMPANREVLEFMDPA